MQVILLIFEFTNDFPKEYKFNGGINKFEMKIKPMKSNNYVGNRVERRQAFSLSKTLSNLSGKTK